MASEESIKESIISEVLKEAKDNPKVRAAGDNLAQTAVTLTSTVNNLLLPLAAVNYSVNKIKIYFANQFQSDLSEKTKAIPQEEIIEPKISIAGPAIQGLGFTHEEPSLKDMYLNLLAMAMDKRVTDQVHPAFVEIIRQLNADEAHLINNVLCKKYGSTIVEIRSRKIVDRDFTYTLKKTHLLPFMFMDTIETPYDNKQISAMVDNWIRLGLVTVAYDKHFTEDDAYLWVKDHPEFLQLCQKEKIESPDREVYYQEGVIVSTDFGRQFALAVGLDT